MYIRDRSNNLFKLEQIVGGMCNMRKTIKTFQLFVRLEKKSIQIEYGNHIKYNKNNELIFKYN